MLPAPLKAGASGAAKRGFIIITGFCYHLDGWDDSPGD